MHSLYQSLLAQHSRQLTPVRCAKSTIAQLHRYFEEVVLENHLAAMVVESLPTSVERSAREVARVEDLGRVAQNCFFSVTKKDTLARLMSGRAKDQSKIVFLDRADQGTNCERYVVIADARFSALLAAVHEEEDEENSSGDLVVWTFDPDIVYSALEYLMARVTAEHPFHAKLFAKAVSVSMSNTTSLQLTLSVTTKLARLLQAQAEREIAVNRIATAIRNSLSLDGVLQTAASEVGRALNVKCCAVRVEGKLVCREMTKAYFRSDVTFEGATDGGLLGDLEEVSAHLSTSLTPWVVDSDDAAAKSTLAQAAVPLIFQGGFVGFLLVRSDDPARVWADNELMLMHTVSHQLTVAVNQAHLFAQMQELALTDGLTGCYNRRSFELQLERDLHLATRTRQPLSLIMLDLDKFKQINDHAGHEAGDDALRMFAHTLRSELRAVDTPARFGGDEFAVILPQASIEGAMVVAERLRSRLARTEIPGFGSLTASFGLASYPAHAFSRDTLVDAADRALFNSKRLGRNQISAACEDPSKTRLAGPVPFPAKDEFAELLQKL